MSENATKGRMPVLFVGHGSPMHAIEDNQWSRNFQMLAGLLPRPKAVVAVSAHWYRPGTWVTGNERPKTIHDFGGFPQALFEVQYPAPGDVALAKRIVSMLGPDRAALNHDWGFDHGTWTVLKYLLPKADVPVVQLSIDETLPVHGHAAIAERLASLRDEGVLILGSGNITHNLRDAFGRMRSGDQATPDWAARFDAEATQAIEQHDVGFLERLAESDIGRLSNPSLDHYLPLLYTMGATRPDDAVVFPVQGFDWGSLSMRAVLTG